MNGVQDIGEPSKPPVGVTVLEPGGKAPDFTLLDQGGDKFSLSDSLTSRTVPHLVYFCPDA